MSLCLLQYNFCRRARRMSWIGLRQRRTSWASTKGGEGSHRPQRYSEEGEWNSWLSTDVLSEMDQMSFFANNSKSGCVPSGRTRFIMWVGGKCRGICWPSLQFSWVSPALSKSSSGLSNSGSHCINPVGSKQDSVDALQSGGCPVDFS